MVCARSLLRIQIDTALRFHAVYLVDNPHDFCMQILDGKQINHQKDSEGNKLNDAYLVKKLSSEYPWLTTVYKNLSGYIHLSDKHLFIPVQSVDHDNRSIQFSINDQDTKYPESSWEEVIGCFNESTDIFIKDLEGWIYTKSNPKKVNELKEQKENKQG